MNLYEKVKAVADKKGMTISSVEKSAGLANGTIGKWREADGARIKSVLAVAEALKVNVKDLL